MGLAQKVTKIGKLSTIYMLSTIIAQVVGLFLLPIFTRYLEPDQMGIIGLAAQVILPLSIVVQLGLWSSLKSHYFRTDKSVRPLMVRTVLLGQLVQTGLICSLLSLVGIWFSERFLPNLPLSSERVYCLWLMIVWGCFFQAWFRIATGLTQLHERAFTTVFLTLLQLFLRVGLGLFVVVYLGWKGFGRQSSIFATIVLTGAAAFVIVWRYGRGGFDFSLFKKILRTGLTFVPHGFAGVLALSVNGWLLNKLVSPAALGIYGIAVMFGQLIQMPLNSFGNAAFPTLARMMKDGSAEARRQQSRIYTLLIAGVAVLALGIVLFAPIAIILLTAPKYHESMYIVPILVLAWTFQGFYWIASNRVFYLGGGLWLATATVSSLGVGIALGFLLMPPYGMYGAAMAMVGTFVVRTMVILVIGERMYPVPWQLWES